MKSFLHLDFESASTQELRREKSVGLHNYWTHPDTKPLMLAWAYDDEPVELWQIGLEEIPDKLLQGLEDPDQPLAAFNSTFERYALKYKLGMDTEINRWYDPQASARYLSLPGDLETVGQVLGLPAALAKDKRGEDLIELFSKSHKQKKLKRGDPDVWVFYNSKTHPKEWQEFCDYCKQDVVAEREIMRRETLLHAFPLPQLEQEIWQFDQTVNDRGMPVDVEFVKKMYALASRSKQEAVDKQNKLTGLENANSPIQMLAWAKEQGYEPGTLRKETVTAQLAYHSDTMTPLCIEVLEARKAASSTTYKKLSAVLRQVSSDNRLCNAFIYMGSSRCGRWSSGAAQLHNLARPGVLNGYNFEDEDVINEARLMVRNMDYDGIKERYGSVLLVVKYLIRTCFSCEGLE